MNVLVLCTGNSCRSILGEALINSRGRGRLRAFSAGSRPTGVVNPHALSTLARHGLSADGYASKPWSAFEQSRIDLLISVCDAAAGEVCPAYLRSVPRVHWGLPDPAAVTGSDVAIQQAFDATYDALESRVHRLVELTREGLTGGALVAALSTT